MNMATIRYRHCHYSGLCRTELTGHVDLMWSMYISMVNSGIQASYHMWSDIQ